MGKVWFITGAARGMGRSIADGSLKKTDIFEAVKHAFPDVLSEEQQYKKLSNLLQKMKKEGSVGVSGAAGRAEWFLVKIT